MHALVSVPILCYEAMKYYYNLCTEHDNIFYVTVDDRLSFHAALH